MKRGQIDLRPRPLTVPLIWRGPLVVSLFMVVALIAGVMLGVNSPWVQGVVGR